MVVVYHLEERFDASAAGSLDLAGTLSNMQRIAIDADNQSVAIRALLVAIIIAWKHTRTNKQEQHTITSKEGRIISEGEQTQLGSKSGGK